MIVRNVPLLAVVPAHVDAAVTGIEPLVAPPHGSGWGLVWSSEDPRYGGHGTPAVFTRHRLAIPARAAVLLAPDPAARLRVDPAPPSGDKERVDP